MRTEHGDDCNCDSCVCGPEIPEFDFDNDEDCDRNEMDDFDGQPSEYEEWQDYMGGDDWDQGQYDNDY